MKYTRRQIEQLEEYVVRDCLLECGGDIEAAMLAADYILGMGMGVAFSSEKDVATPIPPSWSMPGVALGVKAWLTELRDSLGRWVRFRSSSEKIDERAEKQADEGEYELKVGRKQAMFDKLGKRYGPTLLTMKEQWNSFWRGGKSVMTTTEKDKEDARNAVRVNITDEQIYAIAGGKASTGKYGLQSRIKKTGPDMTISGDTVPFHTRTTIYRGDDDSLKAFYEGIYLTEKARKNPGNIASVLATQIKALKEIGVTKLLCMADRDEGWIGYKVWPRYGMDGDIPGYIKMEWAGNKESEKYIEANTIQELYKMEGGREFWEQHGDTIPLSIDLNSPQGDRLLELVTRTHRRLERQRIEEEERPQREAEERRLAEEAKEDEYSQADALSRGEPLFSISSRGGWDFMTHKWTSKELDSLIHDTTLMYPPCPPLLERPDVLKPPTSKVALSMLSDITLAIDAEGHQHKGKGTGGGQFTKTGGSDETRDTPTRDGRGPDQPSGTRQPRPQQPRPTNNRRAGGSSNIRPKPSGHRIIASRTDQLREAGVADVRVVPESLGQHLNEHQREGVSRALTALSGSGGFLLADSTGVGKTRQELAVAKVMASRGKSVILVSPAGIIKPNWQTGEISGSVGKDAATMGIPLTLNRGTPLPKGQVSVTTYESLAALSPHINKDTIVLFDEAHGLKNAQSVRSQAGMDISSRAGGVMYVTATPADRPRDIAYLFRTQLYGKDAPAEVFKRLNPDKVGTEEALKATAEMFDSLTAKGLMIKREISLDGVEVEFNHINLQPEEQEKLEGRLNARGRGRSLMMARFQQEKYKLPYAVDNVVKELKEGRQAVVFVAGTKSATELKRQLALKGINDAIELHSGMGKEEVGNFQNGTSRVIITTPQSGGTGHNFDDTVGDKPRTQIIVTAPFSAIDNAQMWGRTHRLTTRSNSRIRYIFANTKVDRWNASLIHNKVASLGAIVGGEAARQDIPAFSVDASGHTHDDKGRFASMAALEASKKAHEATRDTDHDGPYYESEKALKYAEKIVKDIEHGISDEIMSDHGKAAIYHNRASHEHYLAKSTHDPNDADLVEAHELGESLHNEAIKLHDRAMDIHEEIENIGLDEEIEDTGLSVDARGREHRDTGPGGGQYTSKDNHHPGAVHGSTLKVTPSTDMAAPRNPDGTINPTPTRTTLTKQETGRVGESIITAYLRDQGITDTRPLTAGNSNGSIDLFGDSMAPEIKSGLCSASKKAQQWRITFSMDIGKEELAQYNALSKAQQQVWRQKHQRECLERKTTLLREISTSLGRDIRPVTYTTIINPDKQVADIYFTEGYHHRIGWNSGQAKYVGSVKYEQA